MHIRSLKLQNFKRFSDLTLNISDETKTPKLVVLVGPNGTGKSSIFDAFQQIGGQQKTGFRIDDIYLRKDQTKEFEVFVYSDVGQFSRGNLPPKEGFYVRSSYRVAPELTGDSLRRKDEILDDSMGPKRMIDLDQRVQDNYERLVGITISGLYSGDKDTLNVRKLREELIGRIREIMRKIFSDLTLEGMGDPLAEGQFFFTKGMSSHFPYKNLSSGEKGAFDIILDLVIKTREFNNTVIAIDEPELHMHSGLQRALLKEVFDLTPDSCQLWMATHSIGFIRGAVELLKRYPNSVVLLDFTARDFDDQQTIDPIKPTPNTIREIFTVAIEDFAQMVTPKKLIFCEGSLDPKTVDQRKKEFDEKVYSTIFKDEDALFISTNDKRLARHFAELLLTVLNKAGASREIYSLVDRDNMTQDQIALYQKDKPYQKFTGRKMIEDYLLSSEIIDKYCESVGVDPKTVTSRVEKITLPKLSAKHIEEATKTQCKFVGTASEFKLKLAEFITPDTQTYKNLKEDIGI